MPSPEAWLKDRLTGSSGRADWVRLFGQALQQLTDQPLNRLVDRDDLSRWQQAHADQAVGLAQAAARTFAAQVEAGRERSASPADRLPPSAEEAFVAAFRDAPVPPEWIREWFSTPVAEALVADTLYRSLKDFSTAIPNLLQGLMPSVLGRFSKLGGGRLGALVDDLERRLDPEVRRFVEAGSRRALERAADFAVRQMEDPASLEARSAFARTLWREPIHRLMHPMSGPTPLHVEALLRACAQDLSDRGPLWTAILEETERTFERWGERPIRDFWVHLAPELEPPWEAWAELTWPPVEALLRTEAVDAWLSELAREFRDALADAP